VAKAGVLVALEGIDGSGKSTQALRLGAWAEGLGFEVVQTKEPTAGKWGRRIRDSMFRRRLAPRDELKCFVNDRREHVKALIAPALQRGAFVIVDRYYYSTVAYQGARGLEPAEVLKLNRAFAPLPDIVFMMDLEPRLSLKRIEGRGGGRDKFETLGELTKVRELFKLLASREPHIVLLDANRSSNAVHRDVIFELVRGPLYRRLSELKLKVPAKPAYASLRLAVSLAKDTKLLPQEKARRLWHAGH
jgi:dTMP kinase